MHALESHPLIVSYESHNQFGKHLYLKLSIQKEGEIEYEVKVEEKHLATPVAAHGGFISALLDATVGVGALTLVCVDNKIVSTMSLTVSFLNAVYQGDVLISRSKVTKKGKQIIFMEATVINQHGSEVAKASACLNVYPKEKGGY